MAKIVRRGYGRGARPARRKVLGGRRMPLRGSSPVATVVKSAAVSHDISFWLGIPFLSENIHSDFDYIVLGSAGITKRSIDILADNIGMSKRNIAEKIFDLSVKTLERKSPSSKLDKKISSHAVEVAKVLTHASDVFGNTDRVREWINRENTALNSTKPVELFDTLTGLKMVDDILGRIEEGVYS